MQILAPVDAAGQSQTIPAGLRIALNDGWKTYWRSPGAVSRAAGPAALIALATAVAIPAVLDRAAPAAASAASAQWRRFEPAEIGKLVAQGQTVFVDVTADWCVTCIVNKKLVIDRELVVGTLSRDGVVAMRADMTSPDPAIMAYLAQNGRYGFPFNMVYGPGAPRGLMLPELLSEGAVLDAIRKARTAG